MKLRLNQSNESKYLNDFAVTEHAHVNAVNVDEDVALLQVLAARPVQDGLHLLAVRAVGNREPETHGALRDLHRDVLDFGAGRRVAVHSSVAVLVT